MLGILLQFGNGSRVQITGAGTGSNKLVQALHNSTARRNPSAFSLHVIGGGTPLALYNSATQEGPRPAYSFALAA